LFLGVALLRVAVEPVELAASVGGVVLEALEVEAQAAREDRVVVEAREEAAPAEVVAGRAERVAAGRR